MAYLGANAAVMFSLSAKQAARDDRRRTRYAGLRPVPAGTRPARSLHRDHLATAGRSTTSWKQPYNETPTPSDRARISSSVMLSAAGPPGPDRLFPQRLDLIYLRRRPSRRPVHGSSRLSTPQELSRVQTVSPPARRGRCAMTVVRRMSNLSASSANLAPPPLNEQLVYLRGVFRV